MVVLPVKLVYKNEKSGLYVKEWQYSQGNFDVVETTNLLHAEDFSFILNETIERLFKNYVLERYEITIRRLET